MLTPGTPVILHAPENPRLHGAKAIVHTVTEWGAIVRTAAAATGEFRALREEMMIPETNGHVVEQGYTGDVCDQCGSAKMRRNGSCLLCMDCGSTSGCS